MQNQAVINSGQSPGSQQPVDLAKNRRRMFFVVVVVLQLVFAIAILGFGIGCINYFCSVFYGVAIGISCGIFGLICAGLGIASFTLSSRVHLQGVGARFATAHFVFCIIAIVVDAYLIFGLIFRLVADTLHVYNSSAYQAYNSSDYQAYNGSAYQAYDSWIAYHAFMVICILLHMILCIISTSLLCYNWSCCSERTKIVVLCSTTDNRVRSDEEVKLLTQHLVDVKDARVILM